MPFPIRKAARPSLLFVDDDENVRTTFMAVLRGAGYQVQPACDGAEGLALAKRGKPELILLDVDMPKMTGWQVLEQLREEGFSQPIIMLTGCSHIDDRVKGLSGGADDYLCKPCDARELLARVDAALRRGQRNAGRTRTLRFGLTQVDMENRTALREGQAVKLTQTEYAMIELFSRHAGQLVTREMMFESVWGYDRQHNTRTVDTHIWRLRRKLNDNSTESRWIHTVPAGGGYRMTCDPQENLTD